MTKDETKQFNIRIAESLYDEIKTQADKQEITMTEYVISKLTNDSSDIDNSYNDRYVEQLQNEIERQVEAIRIKDEHIQELARLIDQQQQLTLHSNQQVEYLQLEIESAEKEINKEEKVKKGFFNRLFRL